MPTLNISVAANGDDGGSNVTSPTTGLGTYTNGFRFFGRESGSDFYAVCARFNVTIPVGATINAAYFTYQAQGNESGTTCNIRIASVDAANVAAWSGDLSALTQLATVDWNNVPAQTDTTIYNSTDFSSLVQGLINKYNYSGGAYMGFLMYNNGSDDSAIRTWVDFTYGGVTFDEILHIEYTVAAAGETFCRIPLGFIHGR